MIDPAQVRLKYEIVAPLTEAQVTSLYRFLAPNLGGSGRIRGEVI